MRVLVGYIAAAVVDVLAALLSANKVNTALYHTHIHYISYHFTYDIRLYINLITFDE